MSKKMAWLLPSFLEGSGGHRTILQNATYLAEKCDIDCDLYVENDGSVSNEEELQKRAEKFFGKCGRCRFILGFEMKDQYDLYFATAWYTAKLVRDIPTSAPKIYFVQDFEALFNPMGDGYLLACNSYWYGLKPITIGKWLTHKLSTEYGNPAQYFDFCAERSVYKPLNIERENAICFIYQPDKPRRCSSIGIEALGIVKYLRPDVKIYLYGSKQKGNVWFEHTNLEIIPIEECNKLYNKCSLGLCISSSNPSRIPFEMMAAGLPIVEVYMENNLYDMPESAIKLAHYTPESIAKAIIDVLDNEELRRSMSQAGVEYMKDKNLEYGYAQFVEAVQNVMAGSIPESTEVQKMYYAEPIYSDVFQNAAPRKQTDLEVLNNSSSTGFIGRLKNNPILRKSKLAHKIWNKLKSIFR